MACVEKDGEERGKKMEGEKGRRWRGKREGDGGGRGKEMEG